MCNLRCVVWFGVAAGKQRGLSPGLLKRVCQSGKWLVSSLNFILSVVIESLSCLF